MNLIEATETKIVRKVDGQDRTFHFLTAYDRAELLRTELTRRQQAWRQRRERLIENLKLAGIEKEQMFAELQAFEEQTPEDVTEEDWIDYVNNPLYAVAVYAAALRRTEGESAEAIAKSVALPMGDRAKICGLQLIAKDEPKDQGSENPSSIPAAYGKPPESSTGSQPDAGSSTTSPA